VIFRIYEIISLKRIPCNSSMDRWTGCTTMARGRGPQFNNPGSRWVVQPRMNVLDYNMKGYVFWVARYAVNGQDFMNQ
jgi:hypothetical protein